MTFNEDPTRAPQIQDFPLSDADKQYQFLSEETAKQIMIGHRITSHLLFGIRDNSGFGSNKDEMVVALDIFNHQVIQPYQRIITDVFSPILGEDLTIEMNSPFTQEDTSVAIAQEQLKKKVVTPATAKNDFTDEEGSKFIEILKEKAEYINSEEWELVSEEDVTEPEKELEYTSEFFAKRNKMPSMSDAKGDEKSTWGDTGLYKLRYAYSQNISDNSRPFCVEMVDMSKMGALFRYEDIQDMSGSGVNGNFAPQGQSTYNIFVWKGGAYCHHF